jgi:probable HAF family extracellular repeat protein
LSGNNGTSSTTSTTSGTTTSGTTTSGAGTGILVSAAKGGVVSSSNALASLVIPKNALNADTKIALNITDPATLPAPPKDYQIVSGTVFSVGPEGLFFNKQPTIYMAVDPAKIPAGISERDISIWTVVGNSWQPVLTSSDDPVNHVLSTPLAHFSTYAILSLTAYGLGPEYDYFDLGVVSGDANSEPAALSAKGIVVGTSKTSGGLAHAFIWNNNQTLDAGKRAGDVAAKAYCVNSSALAGGVSIQNTIKQYPVLFHYGGATQVNTAAGATVGSVTAINDNGTYIVGNAIVKSSTLTSFSNFLPGTTAAALNNNDQVAGQKAGHAAIYNSGAVTDLGLLKGFDTSSATSISDAGDVTGVVYNAADSKYQGFVYTISNSKMTLITPFATNNICQPTAINGDLVVGTSSTDFLNPNPFLYSVSSKTMTNLNSVISSSSPWTLTQAIGVNANAQIVAIGVNGKSTHAIFLNPRPGGSVFLRRRRK